MTAPQGIYPGEFGPGTRLTHYVATGEFRAPRKGEYYLSGAIIGAYRAPNDFTQKYWLARAVRLETCQACGGRGKVVSE